MTQRHALITGGSSGIGAAACQALLDAGYHVISLDRKAGARSRGQVDEVRVDLTDAAATRAAALDVASRFPVTTLIHNAGAVRELPVESVTADDMIALTNLHVVAAVSLVQASLPAMKAERFGRIVLISSRAVLGLAHRTAYAASKAAMLGLARTWALELGAHGVTCNVIAPGPIEATDVFHEIIPADSPKIPQIVRNIPVRRLGRPEDVARAVMFFVSPDAGFVTGQTLFVCGGTSVGSIVY